MAVREMTERGRKSLHAVTARRADVPSTSHPLRSKAASDQRMQLDHLFLRSSDCAAYTARQAICV
ncbi:MAG: hypothetical protein KDB22_11500, partial [Planctomycetales bacterium]|nr:hypothetical protein [Planctomycetales bacterium]